MTHKAEILKRISENAANNPERIFMIEKTLNGEDRKLTWTQLEEYSNKLASYFSKNLETKAPVIVYGHKHPFMIVCFLACVKSGRAYCPVDNSLPVSRVKSIIEEVTPDIVIAIEDMPNMGYSILSLNDIMHIVDQQVEILGENQFQFSVDKDDTFYIIFTSGSTGEPKGVQITAECLDNYLRWAVTMIKDYDEYSHYLFMNQAPFSFDLSVMDLYLTLFTGGTLISLDKDVQQRMANLFVALKESTPDVWVSTPSFVDVCLAEKESFNSDVLPNLNTFLFCGETLTNKTASSLLERFPAAKIVNTYGPTESTVCVTSITVDQELVNKNNPLPIGREKNGTWIFILNEDGNSLPEDQQGEIVIVGDTVSVGYFNKPNLTAQRFGKYMIEGKEYRSYHTGDKGYKKDGNLYYCGRIDLQVKLHGYRIEIEDVEANLMKIDDVMQAAVYPKYRDNKIAYLVGCVVLNTEAIDSHKKALELKSEMKKFVPEYMIPKKIKFFDSLPMSQNGKIDRKKLMEDSN